MHAYLGDMRRREVNVLWEQEKTAKLFLRHSPRPGERCKLFTIRHQFMIYMLNPVWRHSVWFLANEQTKPSQPASNLLQQPQSV